MPPSEASVHISNVHHPLERGMIRVQSELPELNLQPQNLECPNDCKALALAGAVVTFRWVKGATLKAVWVALAHFVCLKQGAPNLLVTGIGVHGVLPVRMWKPQNWRRGRRCFENVGGSPLFRSGLRQPEWFAFAQQSI